MPIPAPPTGFYIKQPGLIDLVLRAHLFHNQPGVQSRILKELQTLLLRRDVTIEELRGFANKTFKSNQVLLEDFISILSDSKGDGGSIMVRILCSKGQSFIRILVIPNE